MASAYKHLISTVGFFYGGREMTRIKKNEILGYQLDTETICHECATPEELKDLTRDELLTAKKIGGDLIFCDRCKKRIEG
jgi:hypothetical protein